MIIWGWKSREKRIGTGSFYCLSCGAENDYTHYRVSQYFTLYFIPPHTKQKDHPPMAPMLCLGAPAEHGPTSCSPVPGAQALYFGADQPRITAEAIFPWSALGVAGPPPSGRIKVEVSGTAFHRSRWMSLSGRPPSEDVMQPEHWPEMRLVGSQPTL